MASPCQRLSFWKPCLAPCPSSSGMKTSCARCGARPIRAAMAKTEVHQKFTDRQQALVDFVPARYVKEGVEELDAEKLTPLLRLRYNNAIADAVADLGSADQIRRVFVGFQKYLYEARPS